MALQDSELSMDEADEEVRKRLERKALFEKLLAKATALGAVGDGEAS